MLNWTSINVKMFLKEELSFTSKSNNLISRLFHGGLVFWTQLTSYSALAGSALGILGEPVIPANCALNLHRIQSAADTPQSDPCTITKTWCLIKCPHGASSWELFLFISEWSPWAQKRQEIKNKPEQSSCDKSKAFLMFLSVINTRFCVHSLFFLRSVGHPAR